MNVLNEPEEENLGDNDKDDISFDNENNIAEESKSRA